MTHTSAAHIDLYQLTSLVAHWDHGKAGEEAWMSFFSRRLPQDLAGAPARRFLLWAGLRRAVEHLAGARFSDAQLDALLAHPALGPALRARPALVEALRGWRFRGEVWAPAEGELLWANPAELLSASGARAPFDVDGVRPSAAPPYLQVRCDLLSAKLIETPLLSIINHMTMVATKAAHIVAAAAGRPVFEFGSRRTHLDAAVDAAYAAYLAGAAATSNVEAYCRYGVPAVGTMDHFAVQAWEREGVGVAQTEREFFEAFYRVYPAQASLLVDTYDAFGDETGIRNAVRATGGGLKGVRLDSLLSVESVRRARALLDALGAPHATIIASGGVDEGEIRALAEAPVDAFGVGERLVTSADAPVGVGAVGKLSSVGGRPTLKQARGSAKATLPGPLQCYRGPAGDRLALLASSAARPGERALIARVWDAASAPAPALGLEEARARARTGLAAHVRDAGREVLAQRVYLDEGLAALVEGLVRGGRPEGLAP